MKKGKIFLFAVVALFVAVVGVQVVGSIWVSSNYKLTVEEACQEIDARMAQEPKEFNEQHDDQKATCRVSYLEEITVKQPSFTLEGISRGPFVKDGVVKGTVDVFIDCPAAYPYLEKEPDAYRTGDVRELDYLQNEILEGISIGIEKLGTLKFGRWSIDKYFLTSNSTNFICLTARETNIV